MPTLDSKQVLPFVCIGSLCLLIGALAGFSFGASKGAEWVGLGFDKGFAQGTGNSSKAKPHQLDSKSSADTEPCSNTTELAESDSAYGSWASAVDAINTVPPEQRFQLLSDADKAYQAYLEKASHLARMVSACAKFKANS
jgi:hypothetical protein